MATVTGQENRPGLFQNCSCRPTWMAFNCNALVFPSTTT